MEYSLFTKLAAEFIGTAVLMVFGNGAVANVELKNTKGHHAGWLTIAMGYGFGVMFPVLMFGGVSGAHINPAMTLAQAINGMFPWGEVLPYIIAQLLGALVGQLIVFVTYYPHYRDTEEAEAIFGTFSTTEATGLDETAIEAARVEAIPGGIAIGHAAGQPVRIYTASGRPVAAFTAGSDYETVRLEKGLYLVTIGRKTCKVAL